MREITCETARGYLLDSGRVMPAAQVRATRLAGGVSNEVLLIETDQPGLRRFVLKQARAQLRTPQLWLCTVERIWREVAVLQACSKLAASGTIPAVLFEDRDNYLFAMTAAPAEHTVWRDDLLNRRFDLHVASAAGELLASLHAGAWGSAELEQELGDREIFRQLRIEPYYETVARSYPAERKLFDQLIEQTWSQRCTLVHADFSPKNMLVFGQRLMLVDFETGHYGDPAFDLGFFLAHLVLKTLWHAPDAEPMLRTIEHFVTAYDERMGRRIEPEQQVALCQRGARHLGGCLWARLDGKSRVDYLTDQRRRDTARQLARGWLAEPFDHWCSLGDSLRDAAQRVTTG